jgi:hypothetical protein
LSFKSRRPRARVRDELRIALGISNLVHGRQTVGRRVKYLVDPRAREGERKNPEQLVLWRWRRRKSEGVASRHGARLEPSTWRTLGTILGGDYRTWQRLSVEDIRRRLVETEAMRRRRHLRAPSAECIVAILRTVKPAVVRRIIERHLDPERVDPRRPGVPDLFLWAVDRSGRSCSPRFVEVKRPDERLYPHQKDEIEFLRSLGLEAGVFRLEER